MADDLLPAQYSEAVRALYRGELNEFVTRRAALVRCARDAGDREAAATIKSLRKPSRGAWLLNVLSFEDAELVERLRALGAALSQAHRDGDGQAMRRLTAEREMLFGEVAGRLHQVAVGSGWRPTGAALGEAVESLQAALADPGLAERIAAGAMVTTVRAAGFGPVDVFAPLAPVIPLGPRQARAAALAKQAAVEEPEAAEARLLAARLEHAHQLLAEAREARDEAVSIRDRSASTLREAERAAADLGPEIRAVQEKLAALWGELEELEAARTRYAADAEADALAADRAEAELVRRQRTVEELQQQLTPLE